MRWLALTSAGHRRADKGIHWCRKCPAVVLDTVIGAERTGRP